MDTKIFVITHKNIAPISIDGYYLLFVGAEGKDSAKADYYDNKGDNISERNPNYCELTGIYWIWKNIAADIVGICHYRRFLTSSNIFNNPKYFLKINEIESVLKDFDIILPRPVVFEKSVGSKINIAPNIKDMAELKDAINICCPEYLPDYDWYINQNKTYWYNIMITRKPIFDEYCKWMFEVIKVFDSIHDMSVEKGYRIRLQGMISERLLNIWIHHNISDEKIKEFRCIQTDDKSSGLIDNIKYEVKNILWQVKNNRQVK